MCLLVLYFNDETKEQRWNTFFGGHKEATEEAPGYLEKGFREVRRVWIETNFIDSLEDM